MELAQNRAKMMKTNRFLLDTYRSRVTYFSLSVQRKS